VADNRLAGITRKLGCGTRNMLHQSAAARLLRRLLSEADAVCRALLRRLLRRLLQEAMSVHFRLLQRADMRLLLPEAFAQFVL
jgi:hypothetical protein